MAYRKLGRPSDQRRAMLRGLVTALIWNGRIETTEARAKEVRSIAEKLIHLAILECENTETVKKEINNEKGQTVTIEVKNDLPSRLAVRRQIMAYLYNVKPARKDDETKKEYGKRLHEVKHPVVEKMFNELGPKYKKRIADNNGQGGGYTRIIRKGMRRGDAAMMVIVELV